MKEVLPHVVITGIGVKDTLLYLFGVPATALLFKTRLMPLPLPNEIFIPAVTSITVLALAKFNKI
ncbi:uncharacterized protein G2W53_043122 [Senna tora]|uniref:Uncharacterized protein n=1 Tax=Senna tora TaxID=362788 RepID=A0A834SIC6_9FABA|nr:uncharacterized protein G2W53_043122 [Senna tora]